MKSYAKYSYGHLTDFQSVLINTLGFVLAWPEKLRLITRAKVDPLGI